MKKINQMVSVCLATYNGSKGIARQLATILTQIGDSDEIIVSDDCSTDDTLEIIRAFNDKRIKIFSNTLKNGPVGNFENSLKMAAGDIIFLCDQDDIWFEEKVEEHLKAHLKYDLIVSDAIVIDSNQKILFNSFFKARKSKTGLLVNLKKNSYIGCCMSFNRKILSVALPFPKTIHMHDWWIGLVAEIKGKILFLDKPLMYYIRHDDNASDTLIKQLPFIKQIKNRIGLFGSLLHLIFFKNDNK
ncbi:glycosyltransferase family 2 protein [Pedobacter mucosus]|uniref:glycosyltransferase family 2 protein n=1 Tax=Pedobacter mucosus TaxID=2895286 RepID=UPI001EE4343D|nr:glycosyltransferase family 2 protein [Pedobacter mucosus]UKT63247.1 glycosyltransferase family 2 protein [Pedobacter mucosus]